jgi:hypothetical protein
MQWNLKTNENCPENLAVLGKYTNAFQGETVLKDAWGQEMIMVCGDGSELPEGTRFGVISIGEDGKRGTPDDIKSWEKEQKKAN